MLVGSVDFVARIKGKGLKFDVLDFKPKHTQIDKVVIECADGKEIRGIVYLISVLSEEEGRSVASEAFAGVLNRIVFAHDVAIESVICTGHSFGPADRPANRTVQVDMRLLWGVMAQPTTVLSSTMKASLEDIAPPGEQNYGLFRAARQSGTHVEEFMHLYHILLMVFDDDQQKVDNFIRAEEPSVQQSAHPKKNKIIMETVYSRLRNEFAHKRVGVDVSDTKTNMAANLRGLIELTKKAILLAP